MVMTALNAHVVVLQTQAPARTTQQAPATTGRDAQRIDTRELRDQIREQVQAAVAASAQGAGRADVEIPVPPTPRELRQFTIRGPNGEQTVIGVPPADQIIPPQAVDISIAFFLMVAAIIIGLPLARAFARRMDRKGGGPTQIPREVTEQLTQINQAVDAIALEVERISEGQRYTTRLLSEQHDPARQALPSSAQR